MSWFSRNINSAWDFTKTLAYAIYADGKLLSAYIIDQTDITNNPGLISAINTAITDQTKQSLINLGVQLAMAGFAGTKALKIYLAVKAARETYKANNGSRNGEILNDNLQ